VKSSELASELARPQKFNCQLLTILGLVQLSVAANRAASELNAGDHGACYESPPEKPVESDRE
jgi:hypothetical protein